MGCQTEWHAGGWKKGIYIRLLQKMNKTPGEDTYIQCEDAEEAACQTGTPIQVYSGPVEPEQVRGRSFLSKLVINWFNTLRELSHESRSPSPVSRMGFPIR